MIQNGVRLVRSLTDKVRSAMSNFLINPDTDRSSVRWNEDEHLLTLGDDKDLESCLHQIQDVPQPPRKEPSISHASDKKLSNYIENLVKHQNKLSSANLIKSDTVDNILQQFAQRDKDRKDVTIQRAKPNNDKIQNSTGTIHSKPFESVATFTNEDLKQLGLDYIKKDGLLPLDKIADVPSNGQNDRVHTEKGPDVINNPSYLRTTSRKNFFNVNAEDIVPSDTNTHNLFRGPSIDTEDALQEFEKDMLYLSGCKNKTSTPEKRALSTQSLRHKSPDFKHPKSSPKRTQYRKFVRPISPLVGSSPEPNSNSSLATRALQRLFSYRQQTEDSTVNEQRVSTTLSSDTVNGEPLINISPASERWMSTAGLAHSRRGGARRSLFSEPPDLGRYLPLTSSLTNKPLGFDAYQQFMSVSKSDVLPKYFFENEDEEAVYYLKVKYLDDRK